VTRAILLLVFLPLVCLGLSGCKGTEDYLGDLQEVYDRSGRRLRPEVYDAGQLVHEAFAGLSEEKALTLSQMARAVAAAGSIVAMDREVVPLLQAQATAILARLALRYPIPPVSEPWQITGAEASEAVAAEIAILGEQQERLGVPAQIALLNNPDHAVVERASERLQSVTGQNHGKNAGAWENWWRNFGPAWRSEAALVSAGPMEIIGGARFNDPRQGLTQAAAVLNFLGLHAAIFDMSEIREVQQRTILRVARQVVVLGIERAIRNGDSGVRGAGAQAAAQVLDPAFGDSLHYALPRERDGVARARIIEALAGYPGKKTIELLMTQLRDDDRTVTTHAQRALVAISGEDFGPEPTPWQLWWDQTGKTRWP
jgi:HEAT repeat protein